MEQIAFFTIVMFLKKNTRRLEMLRNTEALEVCVLQRIINSVTNDKIYRSESYYEKVIPNQRHATFKSHFRMSPSTFEAILQQIAVCPELVKKDQQLHGGRDQICTEKALLIALWTLATPESYRSIADRFNVTESSVYNTLNTIIKAINNNLCKIYIRWPSDDEKPLVSRNFSRYGLRSVLGAIDGCHIPIKRPQDNGEDYFNRKKFYSLVLQGICTRQLMFIDVDVRWPGSVHDARVLRTSDIYPLGQQLCAPDYYIIGDLAYPCLSWLLCPFKNNGRLTQDKVYYNTMLSKTRVVIENAFALLKGRFRRLKDRLDRNNIQIIAETITACCVLHNICLLKDDTDVNAFIEEGRDEGRLPMERGNEVFDEAHGVEKRNTVVEQLWNIHRLRRIPNLRE